MPDTGQRSSPNKKVHWQILPDENTAPSYILTHTSQLSTNTLTLIDLIADCKEQ